VTLGDRLSLLVESLPGLNSLDEDDDVVLFCFFVFLLEVLFVEGKDDLLCFS